MPSFSRLICVLILFASSFAVVHSLERVEKTPIKQSLSIFPHQIGDWTVVGQRTLTDKVVKVLGVDDYGEYFFQHSGGKKVNLYVSYFGAVGVTGSYHSPKNCLPGSGWAIVSSQAVDVSLDRAGVPVSVQSMIVQNGQDRQMVLYWFQNRGRIIASEYWAKIYLVWDALFKKRRDGSFVRIMYPLQDDSDPVIGKITKKFVADVIKDLEGFLPGASFE